MQRDSNIDLYKAKLRLAQAKDQYDMFRFKLDQACMRVAYFNETLESMDRHIRALQADVAKIQDSTTMGTIERLWKIVSPLQKRCVKDREIR